MQNISKKLIVAIIVIIIVIVAGGWFWYVKQKMVVSPIEGEIKTIYTIPGQNVPDNQSSETPVSQGNELDSIKDLIDGEYVFNAIDTSDWQTYRNEAMGFEVKIPKDWFCGGIALDSSSEKSIVCLEESQRKSYYDGKNSHNNIIMINLNDKENANINFLRNNVIGEKKDGEKIYETTIDGEKSIVVVTPLYFNVSVNLNKVNITRFPSVNRQVFDGFLTTFKFTK